MRKTHVRIVTASALLLTLACSTADLARLGYRPEYAVSPVLDSQPVWSTVILPPAAANRSYLEVSSGLQDYAGMVLLQTGRFSLVDRATLDRILEEQEFSYSGVVDQGTAVELGRLTGAEAVMTISITSIQHDSFWEDEPNQRDATLHVKIISVETSEVLYTATGYGSDFDGAEGALRSAFQVAMMGITGQGGL